MLASVYFSTAEICFVGGPTTTEAFLFNATPVFETMVRRDAIGRNIMNLNETFRFEKKRKFYFVINFM